jgi:hypothetical protein
MELMDGRSDREVSSHSLIMIEDKAESVTGD